MNKRQLRDSDEAAPSDRYWVTVQYLKLLQSPRPLDGPLQQIHAHNMSEWNAQSVQRQFKSHERRKHAEAARCRIEIRAGKRQYEQFHDEEVAEETIAFVLGTDAALSHRHAMLERLAELREQTLRGKLDASGIYNSSAFREAAATYIERLTAKFAEDTGAPVDRKI